MATKFGRRPRRPLTSGVDVLASAGDGSSQPDLPTAAAQAQQSAEQIRQAIATLDQANRVVA